MFRIVAKSKSIDVAKSFKVRGIQSNPEQNEFIVFGNDEKAKTGIIAIYDGRSLEEKANNKTENISLENLICRSDYYVTSGRNELNVVSLQAWDAITLKSLHHDFSKFPFNYFHYSPKKSRTQYCAYAPDQNYLVTGFGQYFTKKIRQVTNSNFFGIPTTFVTKKYYTVMLNHKNNDGSFFPCKSLEIDEKDFHRVAWFSDSKHFLVGCTDGTINLYKIIIDEKRSDYRLSLHAKSFKMDFANAIATVYDEPIFVSAHSNGRVCVYNAENIMLQFPNSSNLVSKYAKVEFSSSPELICEILPPSRNWLNRMFNGNVEIQLACIYTDGKAQILLHENQTSSLKFLTLNSYLNLKLAFKICETLPKITSDIAKMIAEYARENYFETDNSLVSNKQKSSSQGFFAHSYCCNSSEIYPGGRKYVRCPK